VIDRNEVVGEGGKQSRTLVGSEKLEQERVVSQPWKTMTAGGKSTGVVTVVGAEDEETLENDSHERRDELSNEEDGEGERRQSKQYKMRRTFL